MLPLWASNTNLPVALPTEEVTLININETSLNYNFKINNNQTELSQNITEDQRVFVPFLINNQEKGQVLIFIRRDNSIYFPANQVLDVISEILLENIQQQLITEIDNQGNIELTDLIKYGLKANFDQRRLELKIDIPPELRKPNFVDLENNPYSQSGNIVNISNTSGWINLSIDQDFQWTGNNQLELGRKPIIANFETVFNHQNWVLEHNFLIEEYAENFLQRQRTTLVKDDQNNAIRYQLGDIAFPNNSYQTGGNFIGIAMDKNFSIQPQKITNSTQEYELLLEQSAIVKIYINDQLNNILNLPEGKHNLKNFNLITGNNNINLEIIYANGETKNIKFNVPFDHQLLGADIEDYNLSFGFKDNFQEGKHDYNWDHPNFSGFYRTGITNNLTLGSYFQGNFNQQLLGIDGILATNFGNLIMDTVISNSDDFGSDFAYKINYRYLHDHPDNPADRNFDLTFVYQGENFMLPDQIKPNFDFNYQVSANYHQTLFEDYNLSLGLNYQFRDNNINNNQGNLSLGLSKSILLNNGLRANIQFNQNFNLNSPDEFGVRLTLFWSPTRTNQFISASTDSLTETNQFSWTQTSPYLINGINQAIFIQNSPNNDRLDYNLDYTDQRYKLSFDHRIDNNYLTENIENISSLRLETALVFADGNFAFSRPIQDNFALVMPHPNLANYEIQLNSFGENYEAKADSFGGGVIPDLESYLSSNILTDAPELPLGYDLGQPSYLVFPTYKSGTLIQVGSDATVFLRGTLINQENQPIGLEVLEITSLDDPHWQPITIFTNRIGKFAAEGLKPGHFQIKLMSNQETTDFTIPENTEGLYDLGLLIL